MPGLGPLPPRTPRLRRGRAQAPLRREWKLPLADGGAQPSAGARLRQKGANTRLPSLLVQLGAPSYHFVTLKTRLGAQACEPMRLPGGLRKPSRWGGGTPWAGGGEPAGRESPGCPSPGPAAAFRRKREQCQGAGGARGEGGARPRLPPRRPGRTIGCTAQSSRPAARRGRGRARRGRGAGARGRPGSGGGICSWC